jgi:hypothetical protein
MIDVHPAPHAAHSWREFFIHIATIAIGLLLALALEQAVERFHRLHQREQLEAELREESFTNRRLVQYDIDSVNEVRRNIRLNMANLDRDGKAFVPIPPPHDTFLPFINTAWIAARSNGALALLPDQFAGSHWRVNVLVDAMSASIATLADARKKVNSLLYLHASPSQLTADERAALLRAYSEEDQEIGNLNYILLGFDFMNEDAIAGHIPSIAEVAAESQRAQKSEGHPPLP